MHPISHLRGLALLGLAAALPSQCDPQWQSGDPLPHVSGTVAAATAWDPDGVGPAPMLLVVGGAFQVGAIAATNLAAYDGSQWLQLGTPPAGYVTALGTFQGDLIAAIGTPYPNDDLLYRWDGSTWQLFGLVAGAVSAMTTYNGSLIVAGAFGGIGGVAAGNIARWDGSNWSALGSGVFGDIRTLAVFQNWLYAGGALTVAGGVPVANLAGWNGTNWASTAAFNGPIETLVTYAGIAINSERLIAGGSFTSVGATAAQHVAVFTPATVSWTPVGAGPPGTSCRRLFAGSTGLGALLLTAAVENPGSDYKVWSGSGSTWTPLGTVSDPGCDVLPTCLLGFQGAFVLGVQPAPSPTFVSVDVGVRKFVTASGWTPVVGRGVDGMVDAVASIGNEFVIGGSFQQISGVPMNGIARGNSTAWQPLGSGVAGGAGVFAVAALPNGDVIAGGSFTMAGGAPASNIARWNGTSWSPLGAGCNDSVHALLALANGDVIAVGRFTSAGGAVANRIARWNGATWSPLGAGTSAPINAIAAMPNGDLVVGGNFLMVAGIAANRLARWNGTTWSAVGSGVNGTVFALAVTPGGDLFAGGAFTVAGGVNANYVARWDGAAWSAPGNTPNSGPQAAVYSLVALPDGGVLTGGAAWVSASWLGSYSPTMARLHGSGSWNWIYVEGAAVNAEAMTPTGDVVVGGLFEKADGLSVGNFARLAPPCRATASAVGAGCGGAVLTAATLPWVESTFRAVGTGLPGTAIVLTVTSVTPVPQGAAPLSLFFAQALSGCDLLVAPDILGVLVTTTGTVASELLLPNTPPLVGVTFFHQMVPIAVNAQGDWTGVTATNALQLTAGSF